MIEELEKDLKDIKLVEKDKLEERKEKLIEKSVRFMNEIRKRYGDIVKSVLIFGSVAKGEIKWTSDSDILVILDDTATKTSTDLSRVKEEIFLIAASLKDLHIQTTNLTEFWQWIKNGTPELVNYLKYGLILYDTGFVKPIQRMLHLGLIPPSEETIKLKCKSAEIRFERIKDELRNMIFDLRYCGSDVIQAVIMYVYKQQPDPKEIGNYLKKMIEEGRLEEEWLKKWEDLNKMWKDIDHKVVSEVDGKYLQTALDLTKQIIDRFKKFLPAELTEE
ncbi:MAG: nucleotidyltransferase domain-containing protein [Candidatus Aenigmarchaeota archaeon]|nr:nucleotidyltransferase domain-containing protein [Candidatus Aenigmarchaeota archaeon]MDW8160348.1 nucleotidyltransferase domain-containing protein [Candidatus Aenigmarchaeota archaeon]